MVQKCSKARAKIAVAARILKAQQAAKIAQKRPALPKPIAVATDGYAPALPSIPASAGVPSPSSTVLVPPSAAWVGVPPLTPKVEAQPGSQTEIPADLKAQLLKEFQADVWNDFKLEGFSVQVPVKKKAKKESSKPYKASITRSYADAKKKAVGLAPKAKPDVERSKKIEAMVAKAFALTPSSNTTACSTPGAATPALATPPAAALKAPAVASPQAAAEANAEPVKSKFVENFDVETPSAPIPIYSGSRYGVVSRFWRFFRRIPSTLSAGLSALSAWVQALASLSAQKLMAWTHKLFAALPNA